MADNHDIALIAHLIRRAGFGETHAQLQERAAKGYDATVEELLHPEDNDNGLELDLAERYFVEWNHFTRGIPEYHMFRMINTRTPLEEKMILFWHGVLCTADSKLQSQPSSHAQLELFRNYGMGSFRDLLGRDFPRPCHGLLPRQLPQPQGRHQRELRTRAPRALLHGRRYGRRVQLHRGRRQGVLPCIHRLDHRQLHTRPALRPLRRPLRLQPARSR